MVTHNAAWFLALWISLTTCPLVHSYSIGSSLPSGVSEQQIVGEPRNVLFPRCFSYFGMQEYANTSAVVFAESSASSMPNQLIQSMATKIFMLGDLVYQRSNGAAQLVVLEAYKMLPTDLSQADLFNEGRKIRLTVTGTYTMSELMDLAYEATFDFVLYDDASSIVASIVNNQICSRSLDLVFLLDASGSVGRTNFLDKMITFVEQLVSQFDIGPSATQVSVVRYASTSTIMFDLDEYGDQTSLLAAIDAIAYTGGGTRTGNGIDTVRTQVFQTSAGMRGPSIPKVLIVMTDGQSGDDVEVPANTLDAEGVTIIAMGIGSGIGVSELREIASGDGDDNVYQTDFNTISSVVAGLGTVTCSEPSVLPLGIQVTDDAIPCEGVFYRPECSNENNLVIDLFSYPGDSTRLFVSSASKNPSFLSNELSDVSDSPQKVLKVNETSQSLYVGVFAYNSVPQEYTLVVWSDLFGSVTERNFYVVEQSSSSRVVFTPPPYSGPSDVNIIYTLSGASAHMFTVDSSTGKVSRNAVLDREEAAFHVLALSAADANIPCLRGGFQFFIEILDINDNPPVFAEAVMYVTVLENEAIDSAVYFINVTDLDAGENGTVSLVMDGSSLFRLDNFSLVVNQDLQQTEIGSYTYSVIASDQGSLPKFASATLIVNIVAVPCPAGSSSADGYLPCVSCSAGYFQTSTGSSSCMPCATCAETEDIASGSCTNVSNTVCVAASLPEIENFSCPSQPNEQFSVGATFPANVSEHAVVGMPLDILSTSCPQVTAMIRLVETSYMLLDPGAELAARPMFPPLLTLASSVASQTSGMSQLVVKEAFSPAPANRANITLFNEGRKARIGLSQTSGGSLLPLSDLMGLAIESGFSFVEFETADTLTVSVKHDDCTRNLDVVFVVDSSRSVGSERFFCEVKAGLKRSVTGLGVSSGVRYGYVSYSTSASVRFDVGTHGSVAGVLAAIDAVPYEQGASDLVSALNLALSLRHPGIPFALCVVTDDAADNLRVLSDVSQSVSELILINLSDTSVEASDIVSASLASAYSKTSLQCRSSQALQFGHSQLVSFDSCATSFIQLPSVPITSMSPYGAYLLFHSNDVDYVSGQDDATFPLPEFGVSSTNDLNQSFVLLPALSTSPQNIGLSADASDSINMTLWLNLFNTTSSVIRVSESVITPSILWSSPIAVASDFKYEVTNSHNNTFSVGFHSGSVRLLKSLDRETTASYIMQVKATHSQYPALMGAISLYIIVGDVNDQAPTFSQSSYNFSIQEDHCIGCHVGTVTAFDLDEGENADLAFTLKATDDFNILPNGTIYLTKQVDFETQSTLSFQVVVQNLDSQVSPDETTVFVSLSAVDCSPGTSSSTGTFPCTTCASGSFQPLSGQRTCRSCTPCSEIEDVANSCSITQDTSCIPTVVAPVSDYSCPQSLATFSVSDTWPASVDEHSVISHTVDVLSTECQAQLDSLVAIQNSSSLLIFSPTSAQQSLFDKLQSLSSLVASQSSDSKLVVHEAFSPASANRANITLFNEGRKARIGLSQTSGGSLLPLSDLMGLAIESGFSFVEFETADTLTVSVQHDDCTRNLDVVFVVDSSRSVGSERFFCEVKAGLKRSVTGLGVSSGVRYGYVSYSTSASVRFDVGTHVSVAGVLAAIDAVPYEQGASVTSGIFTAVDSMLDSSRPHVVFVISDDSTYLQTLASRDHVVPILIQDAETSSTTGIYTLDNVPTLLATLASGHCTPSTVAQPLFELSLDPCSATVVNVANISGSGFFTVEPEGASGVVVAFPSGMETIWQSNITFSNGTDYVYIYTNEATNVTVSQWSFALRLNRDKITVPEEILISYSLVRVTSVDQRLYTFSLQGDDLSLFNINSQTGDVRAAGRFDRETKDQYTFLMIATLLSDTSIQGAAQFTVFVSDVNDHVPVISSPFFFSASETLLPGSLIGFVNASDQDLGTNQQLSYTVSRPDLFSINASGAIFSVSSFDYETKSRIDFSVVVSDQASRPLSSTAAFYLDVTPSACPPGTSSATGTYPCTPCSSGFYQNSSGQTSCLRCACDENEDQVDGTCTATTDSVCIATSVDPLPTTSCSQPLWALRNFRVGNTHPSSVSEDDVVGPALELMLRQCNSYDSLVDASLHPHIAQDGQPKLVTPRLSAYLEALAAVVFAESDSQNNLVIEQAYVSPDLDFNLLSIYSEGRKARLSLGLLNETFQGLSTSQLMSLAVSVGLHYVTFEDENTISVSVRRLPIEGQQVLFILDASTSISADDFFCTAKESIKELVRSLDYLSSTRVSLVSYSDDARLHFDVISPTNASEVIDLIDEVPQARGLSMFSSLFSQVLPKLWLTGNHTSVFIFTDGDATSGFEGLSHLQTLASSTDVTLIPFDSVSVSSAFWTTGQTSIHAPLHDEHVLDVWVGPSTQSLLGERNSTLLFTTGTSAFSLQQCVLYSFSMGCETSLLWTSSLTSTVPAIVQTSSGMSNISEIEALIGDGITFNPLYVVVLSETTVFFNTTTVLLNRPRQALNMAENVYTGTPVFFPSRHSLTSSSSLVFALSPDNSADVFEYFQADSVSGALTLNKALDREHVAAMTVLLNVSVAGSDCLYDQISIGIQVQDQNDNSPQSQTILDFDISEDAPPGSTIGSFVIIDLDQASNGHVQCVSSNPRFSVVNQTLVLSRSLDAEVQSLYSFHLTCSDAGLPQQKTVFNASVTVLSSPCLPGHFSDSGTYPCTPCADGFYQLLSGQDTCTACHTCSELQDTVPSSCQATSDTVCTAATLGTIMNATCLQLDFFTSAADIEFFPSVTQEKAVGSSPQLDNCYPATNELLNTTHLTVIGNVEVNQNLESKLLLLSSLVHSNSAGSEVLVVKASTNAADAQLIAQGRQVVASVLLTRSGETRNTSYLLDQAVSAGFDYVQRESLTELKLTVQPTGCHFQADIVFVIDESRSVGQENFFCNFKQAAVNVVSRLQSSDQSMVSVLTVSDIVVQHIVQADMTNSALFEWEMAGVYFDQRETSMSVASDLNSEVTSLKRGHMPMAVVLMTEDVTFANAVTSSLTADVSSSIFYPNNSQAALYSAVISVAQQFCSNELSSSSTLTTSQAVALEACGLISFTSQQNLTLVVSNSGGSSDGTAATITVDGVPCPSPCFVGPFQQVEIINPTNQTDSGSLIVLPTVDHQVIQTSINTSSPTVSISLDDFGLNGTWAVISSELDDTALGDNVIIFEVLTAAANGTLVLYSDMTVIILDVDVIFPNSDSTFRFPSSPLVLELSENTTYSNATEVVLAVLPFITDSVLSFNLSTTAPLRLDGDRLILTAPVDAEDESLITFTLIAYSPQGDQIDTMSGSIDVYPSQCPPGSISASGTFPCTTCASGSFQSSAGQSACLPCACDEATQPVDGTCQPQHNYECQVVSLDPISFGDTDLECENNYFSSALVEYPVKDRVFWLSISILSDAACTPRTSLRTLSESHFLMIASDVVPAFREDVAMSIEDLAFRVFATTNGQAVLRIIQGSEDHFDANEPMTLSSEGFEVIVDLQYTAPSFAQTFNLTHLFQMAINVGFNYNEMNENDLTLTSSSSTCSIEADIIFVLDASRSVGSEVFFCHFKWVMRRIIELVEVSLQARAALIVFADQVSTVVEFDDFTDQEQLLFAIDALVYDQAPVNFNFGDVIPSIHELLATARPSAATGVIVLTDQLPSAFSAADVIGNYSSAFFSVVSSSLTDDDVAQPLDLIVDGIIVASASDFSYLAGDIIARGLRCFNTVPVSSPGTVVVPSCQLSSLELQGSEERLVIHIEGNSSLCNLTYYVMNDTSTASSRPSSDSFIALSGEKEFIVDGRSLLFLQHDCNDDIIATVSLYDETQYAPVISVTVNETDTFPIKLYSFSDGNISAIALLETYNNSIVLVNNSIFLMRPLDYESEANTTISFAVEVESGSESGTERVVLTLAVEVGNVNDQPPIILVNQSSSEGGLPVSSGLSIGDVITQVHVEDDGSGVRFELDSNEFFDIDENTGVITVASNLSGVEGLINITVHVHELLPPFDSTSLDLVFSVKALCVAGTYSLTGSEPCFECPTSTFSTTMNSTRCIACGCLPSETAIGSCTKTSNFICVARSSEPTESVSSSAATTTQATTTPVLPGAELAESQTDASATSGGETANMPIIVVATFGSLAGAAMVVYYVKTTFFINAVADSGASAPFNAPPPSFESFA